MVEGCAVDEGWETGMWTAAHRDRHHPRLKKAVSERMVAVLAAWVELVDPPGSPRATPTVRVVAAIAHHLRTGGAWRDLPPWFPNWRTVYGWFRRWTDMGLFDEAMRHVARLRREARGRLRPPTLGIVDTQSVRCISVRGPRGYDAGKKVMGRKRVVIVDADGALLVAAVVPANVQDRDCLEVLTDGKVRWPSLRLCLFDGAFTAERCREWCNLHGMVRRIVARDPETKGFEPVFKRWLVERTFGALRHWGGLLVDRAGSIEVSTGRLACVAAMAGLEALINPLPAKMMTA